MGRKLLNMLRVARLRRAGARVGPGVTVGKGIKSSGNVSIGAGSELADGVVLNGNITIGERSRIEKLVEILGNIQVGSQTVIGAYSFLSTMPAASMKIGSDVLVNAFSVIGAAERVEIGDHGIFAAYLQITDASHGISKTDELIKHAPFETAPVRIEENVWLGSSVTITMGVTIGAGSVIGAKALVTRSIPPMSVAYGVPAKVVRSRAMTQVGTA